MKKKYGDPRRSEITIDTSDLDVEDLIADEEMVITLTKQGYIKRMNANVYRNQHKRWRWRYRHEDEGRRLCNTNYACTYA